jgi:hypothetical protein
MRMIFMTLLLAPFWGFSQSDSTSNFSKIELRKKMPAYLAFSVGSSYSSLRDFATSPLIYSGVQGNIALSRLKVNQKRESEIGASYAFGNYLSDYNEHSSVSKVQTLSVYYSGLYQLSNLSSEDLNVKVGGLVNATSNFRMNESFLNNAVGVEIIPTVFGSIKIEKDLSRKEGKDKKFLFMKYHVTPRERNLAFRLNIGLINSSYRNGFVYLEQSSVVNDFNLFDDYEFRVFSGFRASSALDYTIFLKNKNKIQISYLWDAYTTGGDLEKFEMAQHLLRFTFLFNTNNK